MPGQVSINGSALRDELARRQPPSGRARVVWTLRRVCTGFAGVYLAVFALPGLIAGAARSIFASPAIWIELGLSLVVAVGLTAWTLRDSRRPVDARLQQSTAVLERGWVQLSQGRWFLRVLLAGVAMATFIGLVVGVLLAIRSPAGELVAGSRVLTVLTFYGFTLAWAIPVAFGLRWFWLRRVRRFIVAA